MRASTAKNYVGKLVGGALYLHETAVPLADPGVREKVARAAELVGSRCWNVVKVQRAHVSLLQYEDFDEVAFPALLVSVRVALATGESVVTDYRARANPPILHRKEVLLAADDPRRPAFAALTRAAEEHGLFTEPHRIGTKQVWLQRIETAGLEIRGGKLIPREIDSVDVARYKTAITRRELSQPMQIMLAHGIVAEGRSIFDYGCGQGDDIAALTANGFEAYGWDPHHAPDGLRKPADIVNLGFVLNVVEDPHERAETLKAAWSFAGKAMSVAVMVTGKISTSGLRPYRDGYLTARGTFQKYFAQHELRAFVQEVLGEAPIALAPGVVAVFRDKELEQEFLFRRRSRRPERPLRFRPPERERVTTRPSRKRGAPQQTATKPTFSEILAPQLRVLWDLALDLGRMPDAEEVPAGVMESLQAARVSYARAAEKCLQQFDRVDLEASGTSRREDLLVHFALTLFPGAPRYATLPRSIQRDVRFFLGSHAAALAEAESILFSAGNPDAIRAGVKAAVDAELGGMRDEHTFRFHTSTLNRLPAVLRVLVGCAGVLQGGVEAADFVDVKLGVPRLSILTCDDIDKPLPLIVEKIRVDLGRLRVRAERSTGMVLYLKSRFLPRDHTNIDQQQAFDAALLGAGLVTADGKGPPANDAAVRAILAGAFTHPDVTSAPGGAEPAYASSSDGTERSVDGEPETRVDHAQCGSPPVRSS